MSKQAVAVLVIVVFLIVGGWLAWKYFFDKPPKIVDGPDETANDDPLCTYVSDKLQLNCVVGLASEGVLGPGHFVEYPANATAHTKVPFPDGDLRSEEHTSEFQSHSFISYAV